MKQFTLSLHTWKVFFFLILFLLTWRQGSAQPNLVQKPSFENPDSCVTQYSDPDTTNNEHDQLVKRLATWNTATIGSPDYFNTCNTYTCVNGLAFHSGLTTGDFLKTVNVPSNLFGYQQARTGNAYAGIIAGSDNQKEFAEGSFSAPLKPNRRYLVSFWVSLANGSNFALKHLGAYICRGNYYESTTQTITPLPHILSNDTITDTASWVLVQGVYVAQGNEDHIVLGHFGSVAADSFHVQNSTACYSSGRWAYYYIDDVSVTEICSCDTPELGTKYNKVLAFSVPPDPNKCYYSLDIESNSGACAVRSAKIVELPSNSVLLAKTDFNDGLITPGSGLHTNVLRVPDYIAVPKFSGKKIIKTIFYDASGNELCSQTDTIESCDCCKTGYYTAGIASAETSPAGKCCWDIALASDPNACDLSGMKVRSADGITTLMPFTAFNLGLLHAGQIRPGAITGFCLNRFPAKKAVLLDLFDAAGNLVCTLADTLTGCGCNCDTPYLGVSVHNNELSTPYSEYCGYYLNINSRDSSACIVKSVKVLDGSGNEILAQTPVNGGAILPGSGLRTGAVSGISVPRFSGKKAIRIVLYDENGDPLPCEINDSLTGCGECDGCIYINDLKLRAVKITSSAGNCCWKLYLSNPKVCDVNLFKGFMLGVASPGSTMLSSADAQWNSTILGGSYIKWESPSGINVIPADSEIYLGNLCMNAKSRHILRLGVTYSGDQFDMCDGPDDTLSCECIDFACNHAGWISMRLVYQPTPSGCCWTVYAKNNGECALKATSLGIGTDKSVISAGNGDWNIYPPNSSFSAVQWADPSGNSVLQPGQEVKLGTFCVPPNSGKVKIWKMADQCMDVLIGQVDCTTGKGIGKRSITTATEENALIPVIAQATFSAYPNPFGQELNLRYSLERDSRVRIEIYDVTGRLVDAVDDHYLRSDGEKQLSYDASQLGKGVYVLKLVADGVVSSISVVK